MYQYEQEDIRKYRQQGYSCYAIARALGLDFGTVKAYCRNNSISPLTSVKSKQENQVLSVCEQCGRIFVQERTGHPAKFCSTACRKKNWFFSQALEEDFVTSCSIQNEVFNKALAFSREESDEWHGLIKEVKNGS